MFSSLPTSGNYAFLVLLICRLDAKSVL
uniref:Uncharacterized protein n=1 Tax=Arundo donax TaxID=35708 RepID=A0A0A9FDP2_ARUDO